VPAFVAALADGDRVGAARTIFAENLLGGTCARVCPVEVLCEGACVLPQPIAIGALQRHANDAVLLEREQAAAQSVALRVFAELADEFAVLSPRAAPSATREKPQGESGHRRMGRRGAGATVWHDKEARPWTPSISSSS